MKTIGVLLDRLDDVVEPFAETVGLAMLEEVLDSKAPTVEHLDVFQQLRDVALAYAPLPVPQFGARLLGVLPSAPAAQIFLEKVGRTQGCVDGKQILEAHALFGAEVLSRTQKQVAAVLEVSSALRRHLVLLAPPDVVDGQAQRLDDVEVVVDERGARALLADLQLVGIVHVDDHALDPASSLLAEPSKELLQDRAVAAAADPDDAALDGVRDQRQVAVSLLLGHFVDSQVGDPIEVPLAQQPHDVADLGVLDRPPIHALLLRDCLDRHVLGQDEQPALETPRAARSWAGDRRGSLAYAARGTVHSITRNPQPCLVLRNVDVAQA